MCFLCGLIAYVPLFSQAAEPEKVTFPSLDHWKSEQPLTIDGYLFKPLHQDTYRVIVIFHGCAGAFTKKGHISQRFRDIAALINNMGYGALLVDSFTPRATTEICTTPLSKRVIHNEQRWLDAYGALDYLKTRADVLSDKVGAIGFSHGGTNALEIMDANLAPYVARQKGFAAAVAMYPGCIAVLHQKPQFRAYAPLLIQVGESDDWTPAKPCQELAERSQQRGEPVEFVSYPNTYHGFDETTPVHIRKDVTHGVHGLAGVHIGANPASKALAYQRIQVFFAAHLQ